MKLPRDLSGQRLAVLLRRYGYRTTRQTGSHLRLTSTIQGQPHHITIPDHNSLRVGTLHSILCNVASYVQKDRTQVESELFD